MLNRTRTTLRANLLIALANHNEHLFLRYLFLFGCQERWRKGTVDHLAAWRDQLSTQAPEQACALAELTCPAIGCAVETISNFRSLAKEYGEDGEVPTFKSIYTALRYAGLFSRQDRAIDAADILCSARSKLPHDDSVESLMLRRALERSLHLLHLPEEWGDFIDELLDWLADPQGEGAVFAAYTACYYLDSLDGQSWQGMIAPYSIEQPWTKKALHAVLEESNKNLTESWYRAPHQAATNMLRAINYLRAHPELRLGHRERIVCRCLANAGAAVASRLSHPRKAEVAQWSEWLKRWCFATS